MSESISLNKFISDSGVCSRRQADRLIEEGRVALNGVTAKKGNRVSPGDEVILDGQIIKNKTKLVYLAFNKPAGITCTTDLNIKGNIISYINYHKRIFPIGRLDKPSTGLILLTNDGSVVNKILRQEFAHEKEYHVTLNKPIGVGFIEKMSNGIPILDTVTKACKVTKTGKSKFTITLTQGLNRQIRRMCEYLDYKVVKLKRVRIMHLELNDLPEGKWRYLHENEVKILMKVLKK